MNIAVSRLFVISVRCMKVNLQPAFKVNNRGLVEPVLEHAQIKMFATRNISVVPRFLPAENGVENSTSAATLNAESTFKTYLDDRDVTSRYANLESQIEYSGSNIDFVFYENQIRQVIKKSFNNERIIEAL